MLVVENLDAGYKASDPIVSDISFELKEGEFCCIIGANGCGKTTTLKTILGLLPALGGRVEVAGHDALAMREREKAQHFAYIPQTHRLPFPYKVKDVVLMGRTPHLSSMCKISKADRRVSYAALCQLAIENLADKSYSELSGGQQQLVLIARALVQQPEILIMDEPTASLDFGNQQLVLSRMRSLVDSGMSVLMVTHDPAHAFYCADHVIVLDKGRMLAQGPATDIITQQTMKTIYHTDVIVDRVDLGNGKYGSACVPVVQEYKTDPLLLNELRPH